MNNELALSVEYFKFVLLFAKPVVQVVVLLELLLLSLVKGLYVAQERNS